MKVSIISEYGISEALLGLGLSYGITSDVDSFMHLSDEQRKLLDKRATKLAGKGDGHDKFLRMLVVNLDITGPLYWWNQFDTYKVGTTAQSESKMHTLLKNPLTQASFEGGIHHQLLKHLENLRKDREFDELLRHLPMSFLQRRIVHTNYAALHNIFNQRHCHKLWEWRYFCAYLWLNLSWDDYFEFPGLDDIALLINLRGNPEREDEEIHDVS